MPTVVRSLAAERSSHFVIGVMPDVGASQRLGIPALSHQYGAISSSFNPKSSSFGVMLLQRPSMMPDARGFGAGGDVKRRAINAIQRLPYFLQHEHVTVEVPFERRAE